MITFSSFMTKFPCCGPSFYEGNNTNLSHYNHDAIPSKIFEMAISLASFKINLFSFIPNEQVCEMAKKELTFVIALLLLVSILCSSIKFRWSCEPASASASAWRMESETRRRLL
ncbi:hypothetical protein V6N11_064809 [Hibiscus sabdariffa]|uniref:Uncharacterized protein n=1 Tax=Hibiscus sabdariffa TaxID=183260 RepID=A0ABR2SHZ5_9ROSI